MRTLTRMLLVTGGALVAGLAARPAMAQKDIQPVLPDVLLLVDNSGSMEYLLSHPGILPGDPSVPSTACNGATGIVEKNKWATLVTALTGSIDQAHFACQAESRSSANLAFVNEYSLGGYKPYDMNYYLPWNRIYSNGCAYGAGTLPSGNWDWWYRPSTLTSMGCPSCADYTYRDSSFNTINNCTFVQAQDGLLDAFRGLVRFGLMTLDTFPNASTGSTVGGGNPSADFQGGVKGLWSYYHTWLSGGPPSSPSVNPTGNPSYNVSGSGASAGNPVSCSTVSFFEVGARNQAAPPWEGRLVPFGPWSSDTDVPNVNDRIQQELLSTRTYGATPIAGLLDDAEEFLFRDQTIDPTLMAPTPPDFGPYEDQYWVNGCRKVFNILFTDGEPNMDMRQNPPTAGCDTPVGAPLENGLSAPPPPGVCPYDLPENIAHNMFVSPPGGNANQQVITFVVGIINSTLTTPAPSGALTCQALVAGDCLTPASPQIRDCCELNKIALAGGSTQAYFADTPADLKQAIAAILSQVIGGVTDRTWPVYAPVGNKAALGNLSNTASYQFAASFQVNSAAPPAGGSNGVGNISAGMWNGVLTRERSSCDMTNTPVPQPPDWKSGDDFAYNVNVADSNNPRYFFTAVGTAVDNGNGHSNDHSNTTLINSDYTMRPYITADDGFGTYAPDPNAPAQTKDLGSNFPADMSGYPGAFGIPSDQACKADFGTTDPTQCTNFIVNWEIGGDNVLPDPTLPALTRDYAHCLLISGSSVTSGCQSPIGCTCSAFGAIFHSTPVVVTPPNEYLRDDSYIQYAHGNGSIPTMLYTATMDGQMHAFRVQPNVTGDPLPVNSAANNERWSFFPPHVLDHLLPNYNTGGVALLDGIPVIADVPGDVYVYGMQAPSLHRVGTNSPTWHRILLSGGGSAGGFYYALDITDPENPHFLWQLSTDAIGTPMFGSQTPTPAIAIVNIIYQNVTQQVPVAILPGGATNTFGPPCTSDPATPMPSPITAAYSNILYNDATNARLLPNVNPSPPPLRCWSSAATTTSSTGNSITFARLDTGEVLGHFVGNNYSGAPATKGNNGNGNGNGHNNNNNSSNVFSAPFIAPLSGVPVAYPGQTGEVSDRVYIGDADGLVWRIDMSNPDMTQWAANIALEWDAYLDDPVHSAGFGAVNPRESMGVVPLIGRDPIGNPILLVATGDQDKFSTQQTSNHVWSLTEAPLTRKVSPNWHVRLPDQTGGLGGARITGPMELFNGVLYFATFLPQQQSVCSDGFGSVWAVDFLRRGVSSQPNAVPALMSQPTSPSPWPAPSFPTGAPGAFIYGADGSAKTIIMGVSVAETPTCDSSVSFSDSYFGGHNAASGVSSSSYHVTWQTGAGTGLNTSSTAAQNDLVKGVQYLQPSSPGAGTRIDSWASIVE